MKVLSFGEILLRLHHNFVKNITNTLFSIIVSFHPSISFSIVNEYQEKTAKRRRCENASAKAKAAINGRPIREDAAKADHTTGGGHQGDADV